MNKKILFIKGDAGAGGYYRMELPARTLKEAGYDVTLTTVLSPGAMETVISVLNGVQRKSLYDYDVLIFQLVWTDWLVGVMERLSNAGKFVVLEIDDDYYNIPDTYPGFKNMHPRLETEREVTPEGTRFKRKRYYTQDSSGKVRTKTKSYYDPKYGRVKVDVPQYEKINDARGQFNRALAAASMVQVTTPELANLYGARCKDITVLENCIDNDLYRDIPLDKNHSQIVIGWYGAKARIDDLRLVCGAIPEGAKMFVGGALEDAKKYFDNLEGIGFFKVPKIPKVVKEIDIGLVPLQDYKFNEGKSDLKGLEFGAGYVPVVASGIAPYRRWVKHGINGFLAKNGYDWVRYLKKLVEDKDLRLAMGYEAKKQAIKRDITNNIGNWIKAYNLEKERIYANT